MIIGAKGLTSTYTIKDINAFNCTCRVNISGFNLIGYTGMTIVGCTRADITNCQRTTSGGFGITVESSFCSINGCAISNASQAITVQSQSTVFSNSNSGTGNGLVLVAQSASTIAKYSTQPTGTTAEVVTSGGVIRS
ncbi:hypothetical protein D3C72_1982510 [compost metagenome]